MRRPGDPLPAAQVKQLRDELGLTQSEFAERLGIRGGKSVISNWENGRATCDGPVAELVLLLLGSRSLSLGMTHLAEDMEHRWTEYQPHYPYWRQVTIVPIDDVRIARDDLLTLFPDAAVPSAHHAHGFPFVDVSGTQPFSLVADGWVGALPFNRGTPISYLWRFSANGGFAYREKIWEAGQELGPTSGNVFVGALFDLVAPAFELYRRLGRRLGWSQMRLAARLDLSGVRGRGLCDYRPNSDIIRGPDRVSSDERWNCEVALPLPADPAGVAANAIALISELAMTVRPAIAGSTALLEQLRIHWRRDRAEPTYPRLRFLESIDTAAMASDVAAHMRRLSQNAPAIPMTRRAQRKVLEYLESANGSYQPLGASGGFASRFDIPNVDMLADVIWYLAARGFIEISSESRVLRPILEEVHARGLPGERPPPAFIQAAKDGVTEAKLTVAGGDYLFALRREAANASTP